MGTHSVLVVDDEPAIGELLELAFQRKVVRVEVAESAESALERFPAMTFDAALLDKNLPGMNGLELARKIRALKPGMAILMMTGYSSPETAMEAAALDVDAYLEKPFPNIAAVVDRVMAAIARRAEAALAPPAPPAAAKPRPISSVLVAPGDVLPVLVQALDGAGPIAAASNQSELLRALREPADLVVIDSALLAGEVVPVVEHVRRVAPLAEFVILCDQPLDLRTVQRLIELGIRRLVQHKNYTRPIREALEKVRKRTGSA
jgi:DNA-binding NtrC family response regulator